MLPVSPPQLPSWIPADNLNPRKLAKNQIYSSGSTGLRSYLEIKDNEYHFIWNTCNGRCAESVGICERDDQGIVLTEESSAGECDASIEGKYAIVTSDEESYLVKFEESENFSKIQKMDNPERALELSRFFKRVDESHIEYMLLFPGILPEPKANK